MGVDPGIRMAPQSANWLGRGHDLASVDYWHSSKEKKQGTVDLKKKEEGIVTRAAEAVSDIPSTVEGAIEGAAKNAVQGEGGFPSYIKVFLAILFVGYMFIFYKKSYEG